MSLPHAGIASTASTVNIISIVISNPSLSDCSPCWNLFFRAPQFLIIMPAQSCSTCSDDQPSVYGN